MACRSGPQAETAVRAVEGRRRRQNVSQDDFFETWVRRFGDESVADWQRFIDQIEEADLPGFVVSKTSIGRPTLKVRSAKLDWVLSVIRARTGAAGIRDVCGTRSWERSDVAVEARDRFRSVLRRIPGATERPDQSVMLPMNGAATHAPLVIEALQQLGRALDSA